MRLHNCARLVAMIAVTSAVLAGCASSGRAPVEARGPSRQISAQGNQGAPGSVDSAPAVARPGYYIVKRGDTLFSIAHQFERDHRDIAAWNGLEDPNVIRVGQELRVVAPDSPGSRVVMPAPTIEARPIDASGAVSSAPASPAPSAVGNGAPLTEPRGGRIAYSAQAWKDLQAGAKVPVAQATAVVGAEPKAVAQSAAAESRAPESKPVAGGEDDVEWIWPGSGKVLGTFNDNSNKGVDIGGNLGDPVVAAGSGRVVYVGSGLRGYGNLVIIKHNNSFLSAYAHNSEILVKEGQSVQKGQKIAALGSSDADRPKLHFEIRRQGKPVDPLKYLPSR